MRIVWGAAQRRDWIELYVKAMGPVSVAHAQFHKDYSEIFGSRHMYWGRTGPHWYNTRAQSDLAKLVKQRRLGRYKVKFKNPAPGHPMWLWCYHQRQEI